jgi:hypothetical protein
MVENVNKIPIGWPALDAFPQFDAAKAEWEQIVRDFEDNPADLYTAWLYLGHHPLFWGTQVTKSGGTVVPVLDFSSAWNRPECLELNLERDGDATTVVLDVIPLLWATDPDNYDIGFSLEGKDHASTVVACAGIVHERYGNDRQYITGDNERWYG